MKNEKKLKRAITLAGRGPAAGLHVGVLECLKNAGIEFDVWALSCIGAWVGIVYNQADKGKEIEQTYDFFRNGVFRDDLSYESFPINCVSTPDWVGNADALTRLLLERDNYRYLLSPKLIMQSFAHTMSLLSGKQRKWNEGDINRWMLNDVLAANPFVRFWTSMMFKSNIDGLSRIYYPDSSFIKNIKFEKLYEEEKPYIFHNAWNLSKQELQLFSNKKDAYKPISAASMCACSSRPFVDQPVEIDGDKYCEGTLIDTVNFKTLLQDHPELDEIWIIRIGDAQRYRKPENLHDALGNLCQLYEATLGESDVELFKYHLKQDDKWHGRIVEVQINSDVTPEENRVNFARARATGYRAAESYVGDPRVVELLFATNRVPSGSPVTDFTGERAEQLSFGASRVRIPEDHKIGQLELPKKSSWIRLRFFDEAEDPKRHFILQGISVFDQEKFVNIVRGDSSHTAIVFTHGFNTSFKESVLRFAQIIWDMQFRGVPILFSWPSRGGVLNYPYDSNSALVARKFFGKLIQILCTEAKVETLHVVAHSMGNLVTLDALSTLFKTAFIPKLSEVVMAAPDVDIDLFKELVTNVRPFARGMTLYASANDKALVTSRHIAGKPRAGDVFEDGPIIVDRVESIDVSAIGDELFGLNHNVFASDRSLIDDIGRLVLTGFRPPHQRSPQIRGVPEGSQLHRHWRYAK